MSSPHAIDNNVAAANPLQRFVVPLRVSTTPDI